MTYWSQQIHQGGGRLKQTRIKAAYGPCVQTCAGMATIAEYASLLDAVKCGAVVVRGDAFKLLTTGGTERIRFITMEWTTDDTDVGNLIVRFDLMMRRLERADRLRSYLVTYAVTNRTICLLDARCDNQAVSVGMWRSLIDSWRVLALGRQLINELPLVHRRLTAIAMGP